MEHPLVERHVPPGVGAIVYQVSHREKDWPAQPWALLAAQRLEHGGVLVGGLFEFCQGDPFVVAMSVADTARSADNLVLESGKMRSVRTEGNGSALEAREGEVMGGGVAAYCENTRTALLNFLHKTLDHIRHLIVGKEGGAEIKAAAQ